MSELQPYRDIQAHELPALAAERLAHGWRLVVITALQDARGVELSYVFEQEQRIEGLRLVLPMAALALPSITPSYLAAFIYENELQDLFGIKVEGLLLDFKGNFYMKAKQSPFIKAVASPLPLAAEDLRG